MKTGLFARTAACALVVGALSVATAGVSSAATAELNLTYSCAFAIIGAQDTPATVTSPDAPDSAAVGVPTAVSHNTVKSTVSEDATTTLAWLGAKTVDGTLTTTVTVSNEGTTQTLSSVAVIPSTAVPASGTFTVTAAGTMPSFTVTKAGSATISLGNSELKLTPRQADGSPTWLGTITNQCTVKPGQTTAFHTFPVA
jgi:hypothetical protein